MSPRRFFFLVTTLLSGCASNPSHPPSSPHYEGTLVGVWCNSNDGGVTCWAYDEFRDNGTFEVCGRSEDDLRPFRGEGSYTLNGSRMCYEVTSSNSNFWLRPGSRYCTKILAITLSSHRYRDIDTGAEFELTRVPKSEKRCDTPR